MQDEPETNDEQKTNEDDAGLKSVVCDPPPLVKASEPAGNVKVNLELVNPNVLPRSVFHNQGRSQGGCSWCLSIPFAAQDCARRVPGDLAEQPSFAFTS